MTNKKMVLVTWDDTASYSGWEYNKDAKQKKSVIIKSVGWLLKKGRKTTVIALGDAGSSKGSIQSIPTVCVRSIQELKLK